MDTHICDRRGGHSRVDDIVRHLPVSFYSVEDNTTDAPPSGKASATAMDSNTSSWSMYRIVGLPV